MTLDPRDIPVTAQVGTKLRDAAVDPETTDFLPPTNAGVVGELGNPHGPSVVSPGLHGDESVRTIVPGVVSGTAATQEAAETASVYAAQPDTDPVESLTITGTATVAAAATTQLTATADRTNSGTSNVSAESEWSSDDTDVATVDGTGLVTGVAAGTATITATFLGVSDTQVVTVS